MPTPLHAFRIPDELYDAAREAASRKGVTLTAVVTEALTAFVDRDRVERAFRDGLSADQPPAGPAQT